MAARPPPRLGPIGPARGADLRNPFRPEERVEDELGPMGRAGRGLPGGVPSSPPSGQAPSPQPPPGGASPFAAYAPDSRVMNAHAEDARARSFGLVAIVGGLVFMVGAAVVISLVVGITLFLVRDDLGEVIAGKGDKAPKHVTDTGFVREIEQPQPRGGGAVGADPGDPDDPRRVRDPRLGPPPGPATVIVSTSMFFHTIEVDCPGGYRNRGKFRKDAGGETMRATVRDVPGDEKCTVTFQGSEPAKTYVSGNQTKQCTFSPTQCHDVW